MKRYIGLPNALSIWNDLSKAFYYRSDELYVFGMNQRTLEYNLNSILRRFF